MRVFITERQSPVGTLSLASDGIGLSGLWLDGQRYFELKFAERLGAKHLEDLEIVEGEEALQECSVLQQSLDWLEVYFTGKDPGALPALSMHGTAFQEEVWAELAKIPYGELVTYGDIARTLASRRGIPKMSSRAVGGAVGHNPVSIIVPCHRVVGASGSLTGYGGGINRKVFLLALEGVDMSLLTIPTKGTAL